MKRITQAVASFVVVSWASLSLADTYPDKIQRAIQTVLVDEASQYLQRSLVRYNDRIGDHTALASAAKKAGITAKDASEISDYEKFEDSLPKAEWRDSQLVVKDSGYTITIRPRDLQQHVLLVNGNSFSWDKIQTTAENLKRYESLFQSRPISTSSRIRLPDLMSNAWAGDLIRIKAAGLQLYFIVSDLGEMGGQLERVNEKVKKMIELCEAPAPPADQDDLFLKEVMQGTQIAQGFEKSVLFRNCSDIRNYASGHSVTVHGVLVDDNRTQDVSMSYRMPSDLCKNLDRLAQCVNHQMAPTGGSSSKKKPVDKEEWYEPGQPSNKKAGAAH